MIASLPMQGDEKRDARKTEKELRQGKDCRDPRLFPAGQVLEGVMNRSFEFEQAEIPFGVGWLARLLRVLPFCKFDPKYLHRNRHEFSNHNQANHEQANRDGRIEGGWRN